MIYAILLYRHYFLLANVKFLWQRGREITTWIMEFIGKRSHKKSRKRMGVREVDRSDHQEPARELNCKGAQAFFAVATLPQLCFPVGMQLLSSFKYLLAI